MSIQPTSNANLNTQGLVDAGDPEAMLMALAVRDAQNTRKDARARKQAAYQDRIDLLQSSADKLRSMAGKAKWGGIYSACLGVGASVAGLWDNEWCKAGQGLIDAGSKYNQFAIDSKSLEADKAQIDVEAEAAAQEVSRYEEQAGEASRVENAVKQQLSKLHDHRAAAMDAAVRG